MDLRSFSQQIERSGKLIFPKATLALPHPKKTQKPAEVDLMRFPRGRATKILVAPEVGLEFTQGTLFFNDLQNR
jgi:hypothetical protein